MEIDLNKMMALRRVIEEIVESKDDFNHPEIIEAAKVILKISSEINAIMISLCLLARITNPLLFSGYRTAKRISRGF